MRSLPWFVFGAWVAVSVAALLLVTGETDKFALIVTPALAGYAVVGALVASRQPRNAIGWLLLAIAILFSLSNVVEALAMRSAHPAGVVMWLDDWLSDVWICLVGVWIPLLFPNGHLPSRAWWPVAWFGTVAFGLGVLTRAFGVHELDTSAPGHHDNPFALPGAAGDALGALLVPATVAYAPAVVGAMAGLVVRLRRSHGVERLQLKWVAYVGSLTLSALLLAAVSLAFRSPVVDPIGTVGWGVFLLLVVFGLPAAVGASILRHRLYDIDVVINRTLVYGALTATLGATYLGLVLLIGLTVGRSNAAIAVSTVGVAALFGSARAGILRGVPRRFYRRRYDAALTLEAFGGRLRDELDLDAVQGELVGVIHQTVQPEHVTLWLPRNDSRTHGS
jgi:hypothetical protein